MSLRLFIMAATGVSSYLLRSWLPSKKGFAVFALAMPSLLAYILTVVNIFVNQ